MIKTIEDELKDYILDNYKSLREFSIMCGIPYSTINSIFSRGIMNASINNITKICLFLNLSVDYLSNGILKHNCKMSCDDKDGVRIFDEVAEDSSVYSILNNQEQTLLSNFNKLNDEGKERLLNYSDDLVSSKKYIDNDNQLCPCKVNEKKEAI